MNQITDEQVREAALDMDNELGLYIPADVKDENAVFNYRELFFTLRVLHYKYKTMSPEQVRDEFIEYYNAPDEQKNVIIVTLNNRMEDAEYQQGLRDARGEEDTVDMLVRVYELLRNGDDVEGRVQAAQFLYSLENGVYPEPEDDLTGQLATVDRYDNEKIIDAQEAEFLRKDMEIRMQRENHVSFEALSPEEVASKYLRGAGLVDPGARNSGFRVDRDLDVE